MHDIESQDGCFDAFASTDFALPDLALKGMFEYLDAAGIDRHSPDRHSATAPA